MLVRLQIRKLELAVQVFNTTFACGTFMFCVKMVCDSMERVTLLSKLGTQEEKAYLEKFETSARVAGRGGTKVASWW